jgi:hypothetical protein
VRETDPGSRRRIRLTLSDVGLADLEASELRTTAWLVDLVARLDPERARTLVAALADLRSLVVQGALEEGAARDTVAPDAVAPDAVAPESGDPR